MHNVCQYDDISVTVEPGMTAVVGYNGVGKTNLLRGLVYGLTGLVDGLWGSQQDLQKDGTAEPGSVTVSFMHEGSAYRIRRFTVSGNKFADMVIGQDGKPVVVNRKAVDAFMEDVFGMPCRLMFQVCWGRQGELSQLLTAPPAVIGTFLSQVFDTKALEVVRAKLKLQMDTVAALPSAQDSIDEYTRLLAGLKTDEELLREAEDAKLRKEDAERTLANFNSMAEQGMTAERKLELLAALGQERQAAVAQVESYKDAEGVVFEAGLSPQEASDRVARAVAASSQVMSVFKMAEFKRNSADMNLNERRKALSQHLCKVGEVREKLEDKHAECPLCGRPMADAAFADRLCKYLTGYGSVLDYDAAMSAEETRLRSELHEAELALGKAEEAEKEAKAAVDKAEQEHADAVRTRRAVALAEARARLAKCDEDIRVVSAVEPIEGDPEASRRALQAVVDDASRRLVEALAAVETTRTQRAMYQDALEAARQAQDRHETNKLARQTLGDLRDVFAQQHAQARYMRARIGQLNDVLERYVALTRMPFTLRLDEAKRIFVYTTEDGYDHPVGHLSGAQRAMASVALQMALFDVMQPNMNLYLIDEPTEPLDEGNKQIMAEMFGRMNALLPAVDGVMFIVTRDTPIISSCTNVVEAGRQ